MTPALEDKSWVDDFRQALRARVEPLPPSTVQLRQYSEARQIRPFAGVEGAESWVDRGRFKFRLLREADRRGETSSSSTSNPSVAIEGLGSAAGNSSVELAGEASGTDPKVQAAAALFVLARQEAGLNEAWLRALEVSRRVFHALRQTEPRHADLAQVVADALRFTAPERLGDLSAAMLPMERIADVLLDSFIPTEVELEIQRALLAAGWKLTRSYGGRWLAKVD